MTAKASAIDYEGCLLGEALADAAGSRFEGVEVEQLRSGYVSQRDAMKAAFDGRRTSHWNSPISRHAAWR